MKYAYVDKRLDNFCDDVATLADVAMRLKLEREFPETAKKILQECKKRCIEARTANDSILLKKLLRIRREYSNGLINNNRLKILYQANEYNN